MAAGDRDPVGDKKRGEEGRGAVLLSGRDVTKKTSHDWICSC